jgi:hypothetical protein
MVEEGQEDPAVGGVNDNGFHLQEKVTDVPDFAELPEALHKRLEQNEHISRPLLDQPAQDPNNVAVGPSFRRMKAKSNDPVSVECIEIDATYSQRTDQVN